METLGSLIDKLMIVNLKMWHTQEKLYLTEDQLMNMPHEELVKLLARGTSLNKQRNELIDEINEWLGSALSGKIKTITNPSNKVY